MSSAIPPFVAVDLRWVKLRDYDLSHVHFWSSNLEFADFSGANCSFAGFLDTNLSNTLFTLANLYGARFTDTDLSEAYFAQTLLANTTFERTRLFNTHHTFPSSLGIDTFFDNGGLPEDFLRGCGVPEEFITFAGSLIGKPIEYYSCFISYSSKDDEFARRLRADLQAKKIRTWFAPEDLKIGDRFRSRIDESIRAHDKLVLILSEHSINSAWVQREVETALEREDKEKRDLLFPIRLDDSVFESDAAWARDVCRRHIGDFRGWKHHNSYMKAFEWLVRDLKKEGPIIMK